MNIVFDTYNYTYIILIYIYKLKRWQFDVEKLYERFSFVFINLLKKLIPGRTSAKSLNSSLKTCEHTYIIILLVRYTLCLRNTFTYMHLNDGLYEYSYIYLHILV